MTVNKIVNIITTSDDIKLLEAGIKKAEKELSKLNKDELRILCIQLAFNIKAHRIRN